MRVMLRYAGSVSEIIGKVSEEIEIHDNATLSDLRVFFSTVNSFVIILMKN